mmetsp:Transcript_86738/g.240587  ORF Transcript_86738/g.240587 Transcript_86738/m.240587 type:complete len:228 (-) Transcript_86738:216-899(-)
MWWRWIFKSRTRFQDWQEDFGELRVRVKRPASADRRVSKSRSALWDNRNEDIGKAKSSRYISPSPRVSVSGCVHSPVRGHSPMRGHSPARSGSKGSTSRAAVQNMRSTGSGGSGNSDILSSQTLNSSSSWWRLPPRELTGVFPYQAASESPKRLNVNYFGHPDHARLASIPAASGIAPGGLSPNRHRAFESCGQFGRVSANTWLEEHASKMGRGTGLTSSGHARRGS